MATLQRRMAHLSQIWRYNFLQTQFCKLAAKHQRCYGTTAVFPAGRSDVPQPPPGEQSLLHAERLPPAFLGSCRSASMLPSAQDFDSVELPGTFPFCNKPIVTPSYKLAAEEGGAAASLHHPENVAWKCPWSKVGTLASGKRHHEAPPALSWQAKVRANMGSTQQLELLISAKAAGFPVRPQVRCTICPSNPLSNFKRE